MGEDFAVDTLANIFWNSVDANADKTAQTWYDGANWVSRSYEDYGHAVKIMANAFLASGLKKGDRVALWSGNSPRWAEVDFANQTIGTATVPIYDTLTGPQGAYILKDCEAKLLLVQDEDMFLRVEPHLGDMKKLKHVVVLNGVAPEGTISYDDFMAKGQEHLEKHPKKWQLARGKIELDDLATLVYTSGTTGNPKGVMLSHRNVGSNSLVAKAVIDVGPNDKFLSFLPLSHVFERTGGHFTPFGVGAEVVYSRGIDLLTEDMKIHSPTFMMSVPRLYEKIYARITGQVKQGSFLKRAIFDFAMAQGRAANVYRESNRKIPGSLERKLRIADKLVFHKLKAAVGGKLRYFVSGGAALNTEIEQFFWAAGIEILQGYGLTETSPVTNVNRPGMMRFGSVGRPVPGCEIRIDTSAWTSLKQGVEEGEILIKGPMVMQGYFNLPDATEEVFTEDGFFRTGDIGYQDKDGFLFITDRKKEIIVLANGKNVAPQPIEGLLKLQPHIEQACIIGDDRNYVTALIVPDFAALEEYAAKHGIVAGKGEELVREQAIMNLLDQEVEAVNGQLARFEQIKKFHIVPSTWSVESGELTPSLKLKRRIILDKFGEAVDRLYEGVQRGIERASK